MKENNKLSTTKIEVKYFEIIGIILIVMLGISFLSNLLEFYKYNIYVKDPYADYLIGILFGILFSAIIFLLPFKYKNIIVIGWFLKIIIIFVLNYFIESHYSSIDSYFYHRAGISGDAWLVPFDATGSIRAITSFLYTILVPSYRMGVLFFAFIGLIAQYTIWIAISIFLKSYKKKILILLMVFPSFVYWSCYFGKDPFTLLFISIYLCGLAYFMNKKYIKAFIYIIISFICFMYIRFWLIGIFGLSFTLSLLLLKQIKKIYKKVIMVSGILAAIIIAPIILIRFGIANIETLFIFLTMITKGWASGGSAQVLEFSSIPDLIRQVPWLMFTALFRPLIFEANNAFQLMAGIENTILLALFIVGIFKYLKNKLWKIEVINILFVHIFIWALIYCPLSFQNLGTAVRFKLQILPFILLFIYLTLNKKDLFVSQNEKKITQVEIGSLA